MTPTVPGLPAPDLAGSPVQPSSPLRGCLRTWLLASSIAAAAIGYDLTRPPPQQLTARLLAGVVRVYQVAIPTIRPLRGHCRMSPNCSEYARRVLHDHGAVRGSWLALRRLLRCGPWTPERTRDLPPPPAR
ncbi:MAG: membrane protein insertion efficiency factor YidD [Thermoanaerobaculaceae bacterium]|nr:membrane protein insertion efficiency factor YidD [Thermoanaerobaculaceae bacterium]